MPHADALPMFSGGPNWPGYETATAVGADVLQYGGDTVRAEGALVTADAGIG